MTACLAARLTTTLAMGPIKWASSRMTEASTLAPLNVLLEVAVAGVVGSEDRRAPPGNDCVGSVVIVSCELNDDRASRKSSAVWKRSDGDFASDRIVIAQRSVGYSD